VRPIDKVFEFTHSGNWLQNDTDMGHCLAVTARKLALLPRSLKDVAQRARVREILGMRESLT
jgi:hypothetical protein